MRKKDIFREKRKSNLHKYISVSIILILVLSGFFILNAIDHHDITTTDLSGDGYTSTTDWDNGTKSGTSSSNDRYEIGAGNLELDFPYAERNNSLISYWNMSNNLVDQTGNTNLVNSGATGSASGGIYEMGYYDFVEGESDYMTATDVTDYDIEDELSISFWAKSDTLNGVAQAFVSKDIGNSGCDVLIRATSTSFYSQISGTTRQGSQDDANVLGTGWKMLSVVFSVSENRFEMYIDGSSVHSETLGVVSLTQKNGAIHLGQDNRGVSRWDGQMSNVKWYQKALSDTEVLALYNSGEQYVISGDWTSLLITPPDEDVLNNITIDQVAWSGTCIDKIEILNSTDAVITTDTTDLTSNGTVILDKLTFDNGFDGTYVNGSFKIKLYLKGVGSYTPSIQRLNYSTVNVTSNHDLCSPVSSITPSFDGDITSSEWADADTYIINETKDIKVYVMQRFNFLMVAVDGIQEVTDNATDHCEIYFDVNHTATTSPDGGDLKMLINSSGTYHYQGDGSVWQSTSLTSWAGAKGNAYGGSNISYEVRVRKTELDWGGNFSNDCEQIGMGIHLYDGNTSNEYHVWYPTNYWSGVTPVTNYTNMPDRWGDVVYNSTLPGFANLTATPDPQTVTNNVNVTVDIDECEIISTWLNISYPDSSFTNTSMSQGSGDEWYYNTTYDQEGQHDITIWANNSCNDWNSTSGVSFNMTDMVNITFISQTPSNLRWNSTGRLTIEFNITTQSTQINTSSILFAHTVEDLLTGSLNFTYQVPSDANQPDLLRAFNRNENLWFEKFNSTGTGEIGSFGEWGVHYNDTSNINIIESGSNYTRANFTIGLVDEIYSTISNVDYRKLNLADKTGKAINVHKTQKVRTFYNMTGTEFETKDLNETVYSFDVMATPVALPNNLFIYLANESYTTGDPSLNSNCIVIGSIANNDMADYTEDNSTYFSISFTSNKTGYVGDVLMTGNFSFIMTTSLPFASGKYWQVSYVDANITGGGHFHEFNQSETTGITTDWTDWGLTNSTLVSHVHYFKENGLDRIKYKVYASETGGSDTWSETQVDLLDEGNIAPTQPTTIIPNGTAPTDEYTASETINITYVWLGDPNHDTCWLNITVHNSTGVVVAYPQNRSITQLDVETNVSCYFDWSSHGLSIENGYYVNVTATDPFGLSSFGIQNGVFNISDEPPEINNVTDTPDPQTRTGYVNVTASVTDDLGVSSVFLNVTYPNSTYSNVSMTYYGGVYWSFNTTYNTSGLHVYTVWANDTSDNYNSTTGNFTMTDFSPEFSDMIAIPDPQLRTNNVNVTVNITDDLGVNSAWINVTRPDTTTTNTSMSQGAGNEWYFNTTYNLKGEYFIVIWANDTANQWNTTNGTIIYPDLQSNAGLDGYILSGDVTFAKALAGNGTTLFTDTVSTTLVGGSSSGSYAIERGFLSFDTSGVDDDIIQAELFIKVFATNKDYDFEVEVNNVNYGSSLTNADWNTTDIRNEGILLNTSVAIPDTWFSINVSIEGITNITTQYKLSVANESIPPPGIGEIYLYTGNDLPANRPYLRITSLYSVGYFFAVFDDLPEISNIQIVQTPIPEPEHVNISATITDDLGVNGAWVNVTLPDLSTQNNSMLNSGSSYWYNTTYLQEGQHSFVIWTNDTLDQSNSSAINYFNTTDHIPELTNVITNPSVVNPGDIISISCNVTDDIGVSEVWINITSPSGVTQNVSMSLNGSDIYIVNLSFTVLEEVGTYTFIIWANDTTNQFNSTTGTFILEREVHDVVFLTLRLTLIFLIMIIILRLMIGLINDMKEKKKK